MNVPSYINKTAYAAVTTFTDPQRQYDFLLGYNYPAIQIPNLLQIARVYYELQKAEMPHPKPPRTLPRTPPRKTPPRTHQRPGPTATNTNSTKP